MRGRCIFGIVTWLGREAETTAAGSLQVGRPGRAPISRGDRTSPPHDFRGEAPHARGARALRCPIPKMPTYTVTTYRANQDYSIDAEFRCASCGYASAVRVAGRGSSAGHGVASQAVVAAQGAAYEAARTSLEMLRCPRCRKETDASRAFLKRHVFLPFIGAAGAALLLLIAQVLYGASDPYTPLRTAAVFLHLPAIMLLGLLGITALRNKRKIPADANTNAVFAVRP
jgi:hypothetical protein